MAYSKQTWVRGEKVASVKLNHMEDGIATISANGAIGTANLANASVTNNKLDQEAVDSNNIRAGAIITQTIYDGAVTTPKLSDGSVTTAKIANYAVTDAKLADDAVTTSKLADESVTLDKLAVDTVAELDNKADIDGSYESMTVGNAEQLVSSVGITDQTPYNFRTTGGSADVGDRERVDAIVGGTVAWNQLVGELTSYTADASGVTVTYNATTHELTLNGTTTARVTFANYNNPIGTYIKGHVYFVCNGYTNMHLTGAWEVGSDGNQYYTLRKATDNATNTGITLEALSSGRTYDNVRFVPQLFDLTAMFGSTIADYIYALEQSNAGAGVAYFRKLFPKPYYAYNSGELLSAQTSAHKMVGFNQWDEEWELGTIGMSTGQNVDSNDKIRSKNYVPILPNTTYYFKMPNNWRMCYYDANKNLLENGNTYDPNRTLTSPDGAYYLRFVVDGTTTYANNVCINLHWDGERDGEYEPYEEHTYALDDVELRGIPKLDANNNLYYDGDEYAPDGTVTRKYGTITLDGVTSGKKFTGAWGTGTTNPYGYAVYMTFSRGRTGKVRCDKFMYSFLGVDNMPLYSFVGGSGAASTWTFVLPSTVTSLDEANTWLSNNPTTIVYELETPTTESADPYTELQICDDFGTEEFVDAATRDFDMPVGHNTVYQPNLRAKLEMSPNSPDGDGDYLVRQTNGVNEYVLFSEVKELPDYPTTDGTYVLKCTVADGTATLSWVSDS